MHDKIKNGTDPKTKRLFGVYKTHGWTAIPKTNGCARLFDCRCATDDATTKETQNKNETQENKTQEGFKKTQFQTAITGNFGHIGSGRYSQTRQ